jgi:REP element-mobilizing transposase RayT
MNKGIRGINIFPDDKLKNKFIILLDDKSKKIKVRILTYCIMDNHYHLIL